MARHGVTYQDVSNAVNEVLGQGKTVTIENVRAVLGTGSISTINNHLRKWKETQNSSNLLSSKENLPDELLSVAKGLWERVVEQANEKVLLIEENFKNQLTDTKQELDKYKNNNNRWQKLFEQWQKEKKELENKKLTLEQALDFSQKEKNSLDARVTALLQQMQEKQARIEELHRLHKQVQENLEHYRDSVSKQRLVDQQQFEAQKQQLQSEIKNLITKITENEEKAAILQNRFESVQQNYYSLENEHKNVCTELEKTQLNLESVQNKNLQTIQDFQVQIKNLQNLLNDTSQKFIKTETENKLLLEKLTEDKSIQQNLRNEIQSLTQDKWKLAQEKFQLEGQLKQFQKEFSKV